MTAGRVTLAWDEAAGEWLALRDAAVGGMPTALVIARHPDRASAEALGGMHDSPVVGWLVLDRARGWRMGEHRAWTTALRPSNCLSEVAARAVAASDSALELRVRRQDGTVTLPGESPAVV